MIKNRLLIVLIVCLGLAMSACTLVDKTKRLDLLETTLNDFRKAVRWGYYDEATRYIRVKDYDKPLRKTDYLKNIRITSYEYGNKFFSEDKTKVETSVLINYYDVNRGTVKTTSEKQNWWFDAGTNLWFLDGDIPDLTGASN